MKAYLVDADRRTIEPIDYEYGTMREHLPGGICIGQKFPNGDVLYVDDEALLRKAERGFRLRGRPDGQPMMSNGIVTGRDDPMGYGTLPPASTAAGIEAKIEWLTVDECLVWFRAASTEPAVTVRKGNSVTVVAGWDRILRNLEGRPDGYRPDETLAILQSE